MKRIKYYACALLCAISSVSCSLDETDYTEMGKDNYMNNATEAENVLLGVYRDMISDGIYGFHLSMYFTLPSDIARVEGTSTDNFRAIPNQNYTSVRAEIGTTWYALYSAVKDANDFIEGVSAKFDGYDDKNKKLAIVYLAEARCLRALYYFELVRWFGHVALITSTEQSNQAPETFTQAAPEDVYKFIEADLQYAVDNLPYAADDNIRSNKDFRVSKGSALGLLAKVYATWAGYPVHDTSKWEKAAKTAQILVESGKHHLLSDYQQLWKNTCNSVWNPEESLIEVSFYAPTVTGTSSQDPCGRIGKWNGVTASNTKSVRNAGNWKVVPTFLRDWKDHANDKRWRLSFADYKYTDATKTKKPITDKVSDIEQIFADDAKDDIKKTYMNGVNPRKWDTEEYVNDENVLVDANMSNINWYVLRYADVLLLYAEALNEWKGAPTAEAYEAVNTVRRRGFGFDVATANSVSDLKAGMTHDEFQQAVRDERAYELAFEGHRRQDLTRWGIYYQSIKQTAQTIVNWYTQGEDYYICLQYMKEGKNELLPIPQRELDMMKQFEQNPGW